MWELNLFGAVLPAVVLLLLMALAVERVCPGYGAATAVLLGAGTMLLPFATLFYDQALSAALASRHSSSSCGSATGLPGRRSWPLPAC